MAGAVPEIPGVQAPSEGARDIQHEIMRLLKRHTPSFPGAQPVSFARKHLEQVLLEEDYFVCEKSDGLRCLMYLGTLDGEERVYLITRKNEVFWLPEMHIPLSENDPTSFHTQGTLIDGELVTSQSGKLRYLMFDMLAFNGEVLVKRILDKRLGYLKMSVYNPFQRLAAAYPDDVASFPFSIYMKPMELSYGLAKVLSEKLTHLSDGLIFTSREAPYIYGTDRKILKWKPPEENSVDFTLELEFPRYTDPDTGESWLDYDSVPKCGLLALVGAKRYRPYGELYLTEEEWDSLKSREEPLDRRIVECYMDEENRWRYLRFRDDKTTANHIDTVESVIESIQDRVTDQDLLDSVDQIRSSWHQRAADRKRHSLGPSEQPEAKRHHS